MSYELRTNTWAPWVSRQRFGQGGNGTQLRLGFVQYCYGLLNNILHSTMTGLTKNCPNAGKISKPCTQKHRRTHYLGFERQPSASVMPYKSGRPANLRLTTSLTQTQCTGCVRQLQTSRDIRGCAGQQQSAVVSLSKKRRRVCIRRKLEYKGLSDRTAG